MAYYRRLPKFDYLAPESTSEIVSLLELYKGQARLVAGGTIVLHQMKERIGASRYLIGLKRAAGLSTVACVKGTEVSIGSMVRLQDVADAGEVKRNCPLLATVCGALATPQVRNMGTIGGNVAIRFSTSETLPALIALRAHARVVSSAGESTVPIENLYKDMKPGTLMTELCVPVLSPPAGAGYEKFSLRERFDYATVAAATVIEREDERCREITIGLGGVTLPTMRAKDAEAVLRGRKITAALIATAAESAVASAHVPADLMFSADYKKKILKVVVESALRKALDA
jgi:aerobic carbon-monoxide dehydrogenase medium subunit